MLFMTRMAWCGASAASASSMASSAGWPSVRDAEAQLGIGQVAQGRRRAAAANARCAASVAACARRESASPRGSGCRPETARSPPARARPRQALQARPAPASRSSDSRRPPPGADSRRGRRRHRPRAPACRPRKYSAAPAVECRGIVSSGARAAACRRRQIVQVGLEGDLPMAQRRRARTSGNPRRPRGTAAHNRPDDSPAGSDWPPRSSAFSRHGDSR